MATATRTMTVAEFLALPDDGMDRWLVKGELRERPMTTRNRFHGNTMANLCGELQIWRRSRPDIGGHVLAGDAGVRLGKDSESVVGIDVAYVSADVWERQQADSTLIEGVPVLAAEILSPSDSTEDIEEKIDAYLEAGVPLVWIVNPYRRTVMVHRPGAEPDLVTASGLLSGEPHLPGFSVPASRLFE